METRANAIDFLKLVFAIGIMGIHTRVLNVFPDGVQYFVMQLYFRLGVPFFFVASGFFYGSKLKLEQSLKERMNCAIKFSKKMLAPFIVWGGCGLMWEIIIGIYNGGIERALVVIHNSVFYPLGAVWFLQACAVAALIISLLYKEEGLLIFLAAAGYVFALLANTYYFLAKIIYANSFIDKYLSLFVSARNGLFVGLFLFGAGVLVQRHGDRFASRSKILSIFFIISMTLYITEVVFTRNVEFIDDRSLYISSVGVVTTMFLLAKRIKMPYSEKVTLKLRRISKYIFYLHPFFNVYLGFVLFHVTQNGIIQFVYVSICCIVTYLYAMRSKQRLFDIIIP